MYVVNISSESLSSSSVSASSYFWVVLLGQFISSTSNSVFYGGAPFLSEAWFPSSERATATAIGAAIAPQLGIMLALGLSPVITHSKLTDSVCNASFYSSPEDEEEWRDDIYHRLLYYQIAVAAACIFIFIGTVLGEERCGYIKGDVQFMF